MGAFIWAVRKRQFADLDKAAYVIFDEDEPVGVFTDEIFVESHEEKSAEAKR